VQQILTGMPNATRARSIGTGQQGILAQRGLSVVEPDRNSNDL